MKFTFTAGLASAGLLLATAPFVWAAGAEGGSSPLDFVWKVVNFAVLVFILYRFGKAPISAALNNSAQQARQNLESAREAEKRADNELVDLRAKVAQLEQEAASMVVRAREEAEAERQRIVELGRTEVEQMAEHAKIALQRERRKAEMELRAWMAEESVKLAEEKMNAQLNGAKQEELMKSFVQQLKTKEAL